MWSHYGIICTGETQKRVVNSTFAKGRRAGRPSGMFNSSLEGNTRRAIDIHEGEEIDEGALADLIPPPSTSTQRPAGCSTKEVGAGPKVTARHRQWPRQFPNRGDDSPKSVDRTRQSGYYVVISGWKEARMVSCRGPGEAAGIASRLRRPSRGPRMATPDMITTTTTWPYMKTQPRRGGELNRAGAGENKERRAVGADDLRARGARHRVASGSPRSAGGSATSTSGRAIYLWPSVLRLRWAVVGW